MKKRDNIPNISETQYENTGEMDFLVQQCATALTQTVKSLTNKELSDSAKNTTDAALSLAGKHFEARLKTPSVKNAKAIAETAEKYALARKAHLEADKIALENIEKKMDLIDRVLGTTEQLGKIQNIIDVSGKQLESDDDNKEN